MSFPDFEKIESLIQLKGWIARLQREVQDGAVVQFWPQRYVTDSPQNILDISVAELTDYIGMYFHAGGDGKRYFLSLEKYHGGGGTWELVQ